MGAGDLLLAVEDALIAAQNAVVAAEALGLGSCYIGDIMENMEKHAELLHLPQHVFPAAMLCLGYPKEGHTRPMTKRLPIESLVHKDTYQLKLGDDEYNTKLTNRAFEKFNMGFSEEMSRSMEKWIKRWCK